MQINFSVLVHWVDCHIVYTLSLPLQLLAHSDTGHHRTPLPALYIYKSCRHSWHSGVCTTACLYSSALSVSLLQSGREWEEHLLRMYWRQLNSYIPPVGHPYPEKPTLINNMQPGRNASHSVMQSHLSWSQALWSHQQLRTSW